MEKLGHEVYIYCPDEKLVSTTRRRSEDSHIIRLPSIPTSAQDGPRTSLFFPDMILKKIKEQQLDAVVFFTPTTLGMMALYTAKKTDAVLIAQHSSDLHRMMDFYPKQIKPTLILASFIVPLATKMNKLKMKQLAKIYVPDVKSPDKWSKRTLDTLLSVVYSSCDAVIAVSQKSRRQINGFTKGTGADVRVIPTGVDPLPKPSAARIRQLKKQFDISDQDEIITYFGRVAEEKDLKFLFPVLERVLKKRPNAKLMLCGDNEYRQELEEIAAESSAAQRIIFTGRYKRQDLSALAALAKIYAFPSTFDTQGLTLHEAALCGLPIVMIDGAVTEVVKNGVNGFIVRHSYNDFAAKIIRILSDQKLQQKFSQNGLEIAKQFTEIGQTQKMVDLIIEKINQKST
jgi:glycosyltransferase involved in cell wall biosynthesis